MFLLQSNSIIVNCTIDQIEILQVWPMCVIKSTNAMYTQRILKNSRGTQLVLSETSLCTFAITKKGSFVAKVSIDS